LCYCFFFSSSSLSEVGGATVADAAQTTSELIELKAAVATLTDELGGEKADA
jgi:hypothetical protein